MILTFSIYMNIWNYRCITSLRSNNPPQKNKINKIKGRGMTENSKEVFCYFLRASCKQKFLRANFNSLTSCLLIHLKLKICIDFYNLQFIRYLPTNILQRFNI